MNEKRFGKLLMALLMTIHTAQDIPAISLWENNVSLFRLMYVTMECKQFMLLTGVYTIRDKYVANGARFMSQSVFVSIFRCLHMIIFLLVIVSFYAVMFFFIFFQMTFFLSLSSSWVYFDFFVSKKGKIMMVSHHHSY